MFNVNITKLVLIVVCLNCPCAFSEEQFFPKNGFVPDKKTAEAVAEAILIPIYGREILKQKPFKTSLNNNLWIVEGSMPKAGRELLAGGTATIEIDKISGKIIRVLHGK